MRNKFFVYGISTLLVLPFASAFSQNASTNSGGQVNQIQPSIIVIPFKTEGQSYRKLLEDPQIGFYRRIAVSRIKEAFDSRGFTTYDFLAELKKSETVVAFSQDAQTDEKDMIVRNSGADIFVEVDMEVANGSGGTEVKLILRANESATGRALTTKDAFSGKFYTDDVSRLAGKAVDAIKEDFLNVLQSKFTDILNNGRSLYIEFACDPAAVINFNSEVGNDGDLLSEAIMDWMGKNAYKNYAKKGGGTALKLIYDDVRIPLKDQSTGMNYEVESFGRSIRKFLKSIGVTAVVEYPRGQIIITIK